MSDLRLKGYGFDFRSGRYQVVTTGMSDSLRTCKPCKHIPIPTSTQPSILPGKVNQVAVCLAGVIAGRVHLSGKCDPYDRRRSALQ